MSEPVYDESRDVRADETKADETKAKAKASAATRQNTLRAAAEIDWRAPRLESDITRPNIHVDQT